MSESTTLIEFKNVHKSYDMGGSMYQALKGVSITIKSGEFVVIMGRSGSGKTTLLNLMGLLDIPSQGDIIVNDKHIQTLSDDDLSHIRRDKIGYIFQTFNLIPVLTALENVEYPLMLLNLPAKEREEKALEALRIVGLEKYAHHKPAQLSGGQRQRVAIARAITKNPIFILADEPTANLDSQTSDEITNLLTKLQKDLNTTIVYCSHDPEIVSRAKRIINLKDGLIESEIKK